MDDLLALGDVSKANATHTVHLHHPDDSTKKLYAGGTKEKPENPLEVYIVGQDSDNFTEANHFNRRENNQRAIDGVPFDPDAEDDGTIRGIAWCTTGWNNIPKGWLDSSKDATPLEWSRENAFKLCKRLKWFRSQVMLAQVKIKSFTPASQGV